MRIVVADGHPAMRMGLSVLLVSAGVRVVGEAATGQETLAVAREERPDVVILGLNPLGEAEGVEVCRKLKELEEAPSVLVHTSYNLVEDLSSSFLAGADSFLHKSASREELLEALERTAAGKPVWEPGEEIGEARGQLDVAPSGERLTRRQKEVLALLLRRYTNLEISHSLHISLQTTKKHVSSVLRKCKVGSRKDLISSFADF